MNRIGKSLNAPQYVVRLGTAHIEVDAPAGYPPTDEKLELRIGEAARPGELPPATVTINGRTYAARVVRDKSLDDN